MRLKSWKLALIVVGLALLTAFSAPRVEAPDPVEPPVLAAAR